MQASLDFQQCKDKLQHDDSSVNPLFVQFL